jgi:pimeloyl-ACP methyl ester carboxylesterase
MRKIFCLTLLLFFSNFLFAAKIDSGMVTVDGTQYWTEQSGQGKPTVILLSGAGEGVTSWQDIFPRLSKLTHVFVYDRAGLGKSESLDNLVSPRSAKYVVLRLRKLLQQAKIKPPYVLVSSGLGSSYARYFAHNYANDIVGMVLINPDVNAAIALGEIKHYAKGEQMQQVEFRKLYNRGIHSLRGKVFDFHRTTGKLQLSYQQASTIETHLERLDEVKSEKQIMDSPPLKSIPLIVMEGRQSSSLETNMMHQLVAQSTKGQYRYVPLQSDALQKFAPEQIVDAINSVLN